MRVTELGKKRSLVKRIKTNQANLQEAVEELSTGKKVREPSDDPIAKEMIERLRSATKRHKSFIESGQKFKQQLKTSEDALGSAENALQNAKEIAMDFGNDPNPGAANAEVAADRIAKIKDTVLDAANTKYRGKYVFGGVQDDSAPFNEHGDYTGDKSEATEVRSVTVSYKTQVDQISGAKVFAGAPYTSSPPTEVDNPPDPSDPPNEYQTQGTNIFDTLDKIEAGLRNGNHEQVRDQIDNIDKGMDQLNQARERVGYQIQTINHAKNFSENIVLKNTEQKSNLEATDVADAATRVQTATNALEATTQVAGKVKQVSQSFLKL